MDTINLPIHNIMIRYLGDSLTEDTEQNLLLEAELGVVIGVYAPTIHIYESNNP